MANAFWQDLKLSPPQALTLLYVIGIGIGTLLLKVPFAAEKPISWLSALFTSTSAMTVTGLSVVDTGTTYTFFGEVVILLLIQVGGLGIMTFAGLIYIMLGRRIGFQQRLIIQQDLNETSIGGIIRILKRLVVFSMVIEGAGAIMLALRWVPELGWKSGIYMSVFHSVSAFNNAGFSLWSDSLEGYAGDPVINILVSLLFITGGIGFTVLSDIISKREFRKLLLHTKLMLVGTLAINVLAVLVVFSLEYNNASTLGSMPGFEKVFAAYFQAVTPRTAGFNTIDIGSMKESTQFFMMILMFIGAGSASTGGGIKLTTFIAMLLSVVTFLRQQQDISIFGKRIAPEIVVRSLVITTISAITLFIVIFILEAVESAPFLAVMFEAVSAFGTVGLSMGITAGLTVAGKLLICALMILGRIGPLTLAFSLARPRKQLVRYPREDIQTG